jgi:DNA-binding transcriptional LysR family regulator
MNWDDARVFIAIERAKTLSGAARLLCMDQATVGRRLSVLEKTLGATLFLRTSDGYVLTRAGEMALPSAGIMEHAAHELIRRTRGIDNRLEGDVRVTTTDSIALEFVIPAIDRLHASHPEVRILLNTSTQTANLAKREADIAVRTIKPENPDLVARRLVRWPIGLFASKTYLDKHGEPEAGDAFAGHDIVMFQPHLSSTGAQTLAGEPIHRGRVVAAFNSSLMLRSAIEQGVGIGELPVYLGERAHLTRVWPARARSSPYEIWLITHQDLRHTARLRATIGEIVKAFEHVA